MPNGMALQQGMRITPRAIRQTGQPDKEGQNERKHTRKRPFELDLRPPGTMYKILHDHAGNDKESKGHITPEEIGMLKEVGNVANGQHQDKRQGKT